MSVPIRTTNQLSKCYRDRVDVSTCKDHKPVVQVYRDRVDVSTCKDHKPVVQVL